METSKDVKYWNDRYKKGGHSGYGSKGDLLKWKAEIINKYIDIFNPESIIELGCGDGNLGSLINGNYVGYDISREALKISKSKKLGVREELPAEPYDLALSIDVIHHITDKKDLQEHLKYLKKHKNFIIYAPVVFENPAPHCSNYDWQKMLRRKPIAHIENKYPFEQFGTVKGSRSEFFIYGDKSAIPSE